MIGKSKGKWTYELRSLFEMIFKVDLSILGFLFGLEYLIYVIISVDVLQLAGAGFRVIVEYLQDSVKAFYLQ
jgi:hypothetical protein